MIRPFPKRIKPADWGLSMTVCIAAMCENGRTIVTATDGALSFGDVSADVFAQKGIWLCGQDGTDWQFLFAGETGEADLILEEFRFVLADDPSRFSRENIQGALRTAYKKRIAKWSADRFLTPLNMEMDEFKERGLAMFGSHHADLARGMEQDVSNYQNYILLIGWGKSEASAMIYQVGPGGATSHTSAGFAAIGSGATIAIHELAALRQGRHWSLERTLYAVASAKFSSERCAGVGKETMISISHKRTAQDEKSKPPTNLLQLNEVELLRSAWKEFGIHEINPQALLRYQSILKRISCTLSLETAMLAQADQAAESGEES